MQSEEIESLSGGSRSSIQRRPESKAPHIFECHPILPPPSVSAAALSFSIQHDFYFMTGPEPDWNSVSFLLIFNPISPHSLHLFYLNSHHTTKPQPQSNTLTLKSKYNNRFKTHPLAQQDENYWFLWIHSLTTLFAYYLRTYPPHSNEDGFIPGKRKSIKSNDECDSIQKLSAVVFCQRNHIQFQHRWTIISLYFIVMIDSEKKKKERKNAQLFLGWFNQTWKDVVLHKFTWT